jgi:hypothetical protein
MAKIPSEVQNFFRNMPWPGRSMTLNALRDAAIAGEADDWVVFSFDCETGEPCEIIMDFICIDCLNDTLDMDEYYMVHDVIWDSVATDGMLCIGCLEDRLGRRLVEADFTTAPINADGRTLRSCRLHERLGHVSETSVKLH